MRTAPAALAYLDDPDGLIQAATALSSLTHADPEAGEACALWCLAIRHAVLQGNFDGLRAELSRFPADRASVWAGRLVEAEAHDPAHFSHNGWVVQALQGAWSAIYRTQNLDEAGSPSFPAAHLRRALEAAVRGGRDTDTVAAIAGALVGARWGASAVPAAWRRQLHGWPGLRARDLVRLGVMTARRGRPDGEGWPTGTYLEYDAWAHPGVVARHPQDDKVWLSGVGSLAAPPPGVDAVVSLCRLGVGDLPPDVKTPDHVEVWLVDDARPDRNPNFDYVLSDAAETVRELRSEGKTLLLHCVQAQSRTPTVAALYGALLTGRSARSCLADVQAVLPAAALNPSMLAALDRLSPSSTAAVKRPSADPAPLDDPHQVGPAIKDSSSAPGHVFLVHGRLEAVVHDAAIIPADSNLSIRGYWAPLLGQPLQDSRPPDWPAAFARSATHSNIWFIDVGDISRRGTPALTSRAVELLRTIAAGNLPVGPGRVNPRVVMPMLAVAGGGMGADKGSVIEALLNALESAASDLAIDVVLVTPYRSVSVQLSTSAVSSAPGPSRTTCFNAPKSSGISLRGVISRSSSEPASAFPQGCPPGTVCSPD